MNLVKILRPRHWIKNLIVFLPLFFAGEIFLANKLENTIYAFIVFCMSASAVYILNDLLDKNFDRNHDSKKHRPIAAGKINNFEAILIFLVLIFGAGLLTYLKIPQIALIISVYILLNFLYSFGLKNIVILDIILVSSFYLLRIGAGGIASSTPISDWLILCSIFISLFLVIGKRKAEFTQENKRKVLSLYNEKMLEHLISISLGLTIISYSLYTILGAKNHLAIYSILIVLLGMFRYIYLIYSSNKAENPEKLIFSDKVILLSVITWILYMYIILYI